MPLYKEWSIDENKIAAIWKISEPEEFFRDRVQVTTDIKNEKRRLEHLAGRFLLKHLKEDFPILTIKPDIHDKPRIDDDRYYFSISHSWPYVAAIVSNNHEAGIDIQTWHPKVETIQHKFLAISEQELFKNDHKLLTLAWCAKEAAYKWQGKRGVDFIEHLPITFFTNKPNEINFNIYLPLYNPPQMINAEGMAEADFACIYIAQSQDWVIY